VWGFFKIILIRRGGWGGGGGGTYGAILINTPPRAPFDIIMIANDTIRLGGTARDVDGNTTKLIWHLGANHDDDDDDNLANFFLVDQGGVSHAPQQGGAHNICLSAQDNLGGQNTPCQNIFVNQLPTASFSIAYNVNDTVIMMIDDDKCRDFDGVIVHHMWNWDDDNNNTVEDSQNPQHTYTYSGYYNVSLTVTDNLGGQDTSFQLIRVNTPPEAYFAIDSIINNNVSLNASLSKDLDGVVILYAWDFGDGSPPIISSNMLINYYHHHYQWGGNYIITLNITDNMNDTTSYSQKVFVDVVPTATFEVMQIINQNWVVVTAAPLLHPWNKNTNDIDGQIDSVIWNFGDGSPNITNNTFTTQIYQYNTGGNYTISMYAKDNNGIFSVKYERSGVFINIPPVPRFVIERIEDGLLTLNATSSFDLDGNISSYCWNFNDGSEIVCYENNATAQYAFTSSGNHTISLMVVDNLNVESLTIFNQTVFNLNIAPIAFFTPIESYSTGVVVFDAQESQDPDGYITEFHWEFGDGIYETNYNSNQTQIKHFYQKPGFYNVTLTLKDNGGLFANMTFPIFVSIDSFLNTSSSSAWDPASDDFLKQRNITTSSFMLNELPIPHIQSSILEDLTVAFSGASSKDLDGKIVSYLWQFGDGTFGNEKVCKHIYRKGGPYNVALTVTDNKGLSNTVYRKISLNYVPRAAFKWTISYTSPINKVVTFDASSSLDIDGVVTSYNWTFGDGKVLQTSQPIINYTYNIQGNFAIYNVTLMIQDDNGGVDYLTENIDLFNAPNINETPVENIIPLHSLLFHPTSRKYLALAFDETLNVTSVIVQNDTLISVNPTTKITSSPYFMLYRNFLTGAYYIMNQFNGLAITESPISQTTLNVEKQSSQTIAFEIYASREMYVFRNPRTKSYLIINDEGQPELSQDISQNNHLWSISPIINNPAFTNIPLN